MMYVVVDSLLSDDPGIRGNATLIIAVIVFNLLAIFISEPKNRVIFLS